MISMEPFNDQKKSSPDRKMKVVTEVQQGHGSSVLGVGVTAVWSDLLQDSWASRKVVDYNIDGLKTHVP